MIGKHFKGSDFNRCLNYVLKKEGASIIGGTVVSTESSSLTREFHFYTQVNPKVTRPMFHGILSNPEPLDDVAWHKIGNEYLNLMGFTNNPYLLVHHTDRPHDHIHIVAGRVKADGKCVSDRFDYYRNKQAVRQLEKQFKLSTPQFKYTQKIPSVEELPSISYIKSAINELCQQPNLSLIELLRSLDSFEIGVSFHKTKHNQIRGISYHYGQKRLTGTQLGKTYTWTGLISKRKLFYRQQQQPILE
ncbi:MAG: relaxase/mobilization nuclease domain-containing protein, partial [Cyanobacteria bacterium P01_G01_bin.49]